MARELKLCPHHTKSIDGRTVTGIFSVFGNIDAYRDIIMPGAFSKTLRERGGKFLHLWQHDFYSPPTAKIDDIRELTRDELPPEILRDYPEASGGMQVTRTYLPTPRADEVFANLTAGVPLQMSFAFDPVKYDFGEMDEMPVRFLRELRLYETSDVLWGANDATVASKSLAAFVLHTLKGHLEALKTGARHTAEEYAMLDQIHQYVVDLGCTNCPGMPQEEDQKAFRLRPAGHKNQQPVSISGLWLRQLGAKLEVLAEVGGVWRIAIRETLIDLEDQTISHIVEPIGIEQAEVDPETTDEQTDERAKSRAAIALTQQRRSRALSLEIGLRTQGAHAK
jgi:HK97 family phage prohead protease